MPNRKRRGYNSHRLVQFKADLYGLIAIHNFIPFNLEFTPLKAAARSKAIDCDTSLTH